MFVKENPDSKKNDGVVSSPLSLSRRNGPFEFSVDIDKSSSAVLYGDRGSREMLIQMCLSILIFLM